jgi:hypothetical protein
MRADRPAIGVGGHEGCLPVLKLCLSKQAFPSPNYYTIYRFFF